MANPIFNTFSLQDANYVTTNVEYRTIPRREVSLESIATKPGKKVVSTEFAERRIRLTGWILGSDSSDLITKIDELHLNVTRKEIGTLEIDSDRSIETIVSSVTVTDPHYSQSIVPIEMEFIAAEPFFQAPQHTTNFTVASGTSSGSHTMTISGTVFAEPEIHFNASGSTGQTTLSGLKIDYSPTSEYIMWSGTGATTTLAYGSELEFNYANQLILEDTASIDQKGVFSRWEPGETNFTVTYSGTTQGGTLQVVYRPRYL